MNLSRVPKFSTTVSVQFERLIGVAAVDATLEEIENILTRYQWGDVYSFLINKQGEAIFHPSLSVASSTNVSRIFSYYSGLRLVRT